MKKESLRVACFVSPHGFGHAARTCAVISELQEQLPDLAVDIFTLTPSWFFRDSLAGNYFWHELRSDVGLVQDTPLAEDLGATIQALNSFLPFADSDLTAVARQLERTECRLVICDISPMGIAVAQLLEVPSVLIENFTWDWIYRGYATHQGQFAPFIAYLEEIYGQATYHIQAEPYCEEQRADLTVSPVSRRPGMDREAIRRRLQIPADKRLVLVTMGGIPVTFRHLDELKRFRDCCFLVPGNSPQLVSEDNLLLLPYHSGFYHPDLVQAADAVIGKVGYSTLAEVYHAGVPFGYFTRGDFRESGVLSDFVRGCMPGSLLPEASFLDGSWTKKLPELLSLIRVDRKAVNGARQAAAFIADLITGKGGG